jgi:aspartate aminotransferase
MMASRLGLVATSQTIAIKMEADRLRREGCDIVDFGPGEPDLPSPEAAKAAAVRAIEEDFTHYVAAAGLHELRTGLARYYAEQWGQPVRAEEVIVGNGGKGVLFAAMLALVNPGDEVIVVSPYWVSFPEQVRLAGGTPRFVAMSSEDGFTLRAGPIAEAVNPATRMIIINSPSNPSGAILPREEARALADLVVEHDLWLVSDETYEALVYEPGDRASMLELRDRLGDRLVFVSAFSKTYAMTGWRVGYGIAAPEVVKAMVTVQSHDTTHAASVSQRAALAALEQAGDAPAAMLEEYRARRELVVDGLNDIPGIRCPRPRGAFYAMPDVRGLMERRGCASARELARVLISEQAVATVPGEAFGVDGHLRISYATSRERIEEGLARLRRFAGPAGS